MTASSYVLPDQHFHVLLHAGLAADTHGPLRWPLLAGGIGELSHVTVDEVGQMLVDQNYRSVNASQGTDEASRLYQWRHPTHTGWSDVEILMAIHCYVYQACDTADWRNTEACQFCEALEGRIIRNLPGYLLAQTWPITDDTVPRNKATGPGLKLVSE